MALKNTAPYRVETFGRDCLGNISGYRVSNGVGSSWSCAGQFCGDIYERGSFEAAKAKADALCAALNTSSYIVRVLGRGEPAEGFQNIRAAIRRIWSAGTDAILMTVEGDRVVAIAEYEAAGGHA